MLASWYAYLLFSHPVAGALFSALQGLTSVFGKSGLRKAPLFGERTSDGAIRERIAKSALNEQSPRGRGVDPLRHQQTVDSDIFWLPRLGLSCDNSVNSRVLWRSLCCSDRVLKRLMILTELWRIISSVSHRADRNNLRKTFIENVTKCKIGFCTPDFVEAVIQKNILPIRSLKGSPRLLHSKPAVSFLYRVA